MEPNLRNPIRKATHVLGSRVENRSGDPLGTIEEIVLHVSEGRMAYALIAFGGLVDLGEKLIAVPWTALRSIADGAEGEPEAFVLDVDRKQLDDAPIFDRRHWPDMADVHWCSGVDAWYRRTSGRSATRAARANGNS